MDPSFKQPRQSAIILHIRRRPGKRDESETVRILNTKQPSLLCRNLPGLPPISGQLFVIWMTNWAPDSAKKLCTAYIVGVA